VLFFSYLEKENMQSTKAEISRYVSRWKYTLGENLHYEKNKEFTKTITEQLAEYPITSYKMFKNEQLIKSWPENAEIDKCKHEVSNLLTIKGIHVGRLQVCVSEASVKTATLGSPLFMVVAFFVSVLLAVVGFFPLFGYKESLIRLARSVRNWTEGKEKKIKLVSDDETTNEILQMVQEGADSRVQIFEFQSVIENHEERSRASGRMAHDLVSPFESLSEIDAEIEKSCSPLVSNIFKSSLGRLEGVLEQVGNENSEYFQEELKPQSVNAVIDQILDEKSRVLKKFKFSSDIDQDHTAFFDPAKLSRIFSNVLKNAAESYDDKNGEIKISVDADDKFTAIKVKDSGKGISKKHLSFLYQQNFTYGKEAGRGIGLSTAKIWLESWGGFIHIESELGEGTEVKIVLKNRLDSESRTYNEVTV
jgi:signal transduction histidine kinase